MNMQALMAQAQKMQKNLMKQKEELNKKEFAGKSELVDVVFNGNKELISININKDLELSKDDIEMLEDMLIIAINDALAKVDKETESMMGSMGSLSGLF